MEFRSWEKYISPTHSFLNVQGSYLTLMWACSHTRSGPAVVFYGDPCTWVSPITESWVVKNKCGQMLVTENLSLSTDQWTEHLVLPFMLIAIFLDLMMHHCPERLPLSSCSGCSLWDHRRAKQEVSHQKTQHQTDLLINGADALPVPRSPWHVYQIQECLTEQRAGWTWHSRLRNH